MKREIDADAVDYLKQCEWPGNIRELENVVQRLMISTKTEQITMLDVMRELHPEVFDASGREISLQDGDKDSESAVNLEKMVENFERNILKHACEKYGSTRKVAKAVGISQTQLVRKKKKYDL